MVTFLLLMFIFQIYILKLYCLYNIIKSTKNKYKWHPLQGQMGTKKEAV